jgi:hypothetical protein
MPEKNKKFQDRNYMDSKQIEEIDKNFILNIISSMKERYNLNEKELIELILSQKNEITIPTSIFNNTLGPLETVVKYLKENIDLRFSEISRLLKRSSTTIWITYRNASIKYHDKFIISDEGYNIPIFIFEDDQLSILEAIVLYFRTNLTLSLKQISGLLKRDNRTIWTCYYRAKKKKNIK